MLEVLSDEALMDLQLSLAAYTQIVMKNVCDTVPKLVYNQLVKKVCPCNSSLFSLNAIGNTAVHSALALTSTCLITVVHHIVPSSNTQDIVQAGFHCRVVALQCSHDGSSAIFMALSNIDS